MNRFAIFFLTALSCLSLASAQENSEEYCKISGARVDDDGEAGSEEFDQEDLFLFKTVHEEADPTYSIRDGSGKTLCRHEFPISESSTVVAKGAIIIRWLSRRIILTMDGDTFEFHQNMFPCKMNESIVTLPVEEATEEYTKLQNVDGLRTKKSENYWVCALVQGSVTHLIFPTTAVILELPTVGHPSSVTITIKASEDMLMTIKFECEQTAEEFSKVITHGPRLYE